LERNQVPLSAEITCRFRPKSGAGLLRFLQECEECQLMGEMQMTTNRREVLCRTAGALTGLAFTGCGLLNRALAEEPQRRREVIVNGKRVRTVDVHAHCHIPEANALMGLKVQLPSLVISPERIKVMDEQGIDIEALSINPIFWSKAEPDVAGQVVKLQNEKLSDICAAQPDRFAGLASVALQHPDLAAEQLEHAVKQLGLRGALIAGSVNGEELSDPKFHPFWAKAEQLGVLIFIHPQGTAELSTSGRLKGNGVLDNVIGNPLETTIALSHLIFEGTLDAYPGLKICAAHAGGYLPSYAARSDQGCVTFPQRCTKTLDKKPTEYLRQLYYDSMVFTPEGLRHLVAEVGASQIVLGTDYPFPWTKTAVDHILTTPGLSDAERVAILGETAEKLLAIKPA
jgi:aminocarboxymuconate-semialdehyde decarboxylase